MTFGEKVIEFNEKLDFPGSLPDGIHIMNPFRENKQTLDITREFYRKFYSDQNPRILIIGINPGRFGAGTTGIPFTDTRRLSQYCGITCHGFQTYEPSSAFIYDMIRAYGGVSKFFSEFFISAICPLGFTASGKNNKPVNYNYYDSKELLQSVYPFILETLQQQIAFGINPEVCFCLGTGKNETVLRKLNEQYHFFHRIVALEHPRFIMQYKAKAKPGYIEKYINMLKSNR